jgi:regulator of sigma E protease
MLITIVAFIIILSILIFVHEFGHFVVAKKTGIKVEEFGFGFPPRIWGKKIGETIYSINALPIGGFVRLFGEELAEEAELERGKAPKRAFFAKPKKVRVAVLLSGVLMNFALAVVSFSVIYTKIGIPTQTENVSIVGIAENSPAAEVGLKLDDVVISVDREKIKSNESFIQATEGKAGQEMLVGIKRGEESLTLLITPRKDPPEGEGPLGVVISQMEMKFYPFWQMPIRGSIEGFKEALAWTRLVLGAFGGMIVRLFTAGEVPRDIAGPIGIFQITSGAVKSGYLAVLQFLGILSVNLAILNILPFPALDGGRLVFIGYEVVTGRRPKPSLERWINTVGMVFLIFLLLLVTINDIARVIETSGLISRLSSFRNLLPF